MGLAGWGSAPWRLPDGPDEAVSALARRLPPPPSACGRNAAFTRPCTRPLFGTSTEHTTCPVRRSSSGRPLRHVGRLADAPQVPSDARRLRDKREQLHPSAAAWAGQNVEPKRPFEKFRPRTVGASARAARDGPAAYSPTRPPPAYRTVCRRGAGTDAARRLRSESGSRSTATVPSEKGRFSWVESRPSGWGDLVVVDGEM
jgi:hypothetical protein